MNGPFGTILAQATAALDNPQLQRVATPILAILRRLSVASSSPSIRLAAIPVLLAFAFHKWLHRKKVYGLPGPKLGVFPVMGNLMELIDVQPGVHENAEVAKHKSRIYSMFGFMNRQRVVVLDPAVLKHILVTNYANYVKSDLFVTFAHPFTGDGLVLAEGDVHKRQRAMLQPIFNHANIRGMAPTFHAVAKRLTALWSKSLESSGSDVLEVQSTLSMATMDAIGIVGFGFDYQALDPSVSNPLRDAYAEVLKPPGSVTGLFEFFIPSLSKLPTPRNRRKWAAFRMIYRIIDEFIDARRADPDTIAESPDILSLLLREQGRDADKVSTKELRDHCLTFLTAGHETTSTLLSWILLVLSNDRECQQRLRDEIDAAFPDSSTMPPMERVQALPYLNCIVKEVLRLRPPVASTSRVSLEKDVWPTGHVIPSGAEVAIAQAGVQSSPEFWGADSYEFKPERWLDGSLETKENFNLMYIPFLAGPRICIGMKLALIEVKYLLLEIVRGFEFSPVPDATYKSQWSLTVHPHPNLRLVLKPRS